MERTVDVRATSAEVIDLAVRVIAHHAGIAEHNEVVAKGAFGKSGLLGKHNAGELRVGTISLDHETTRVQIAWADGESSLAAHTLLDGLAPHAIEPTAGAANGASSEQSTNSISAPTHFCTQCGSTLQSADASFCTQCGTHVSKPADTSLPDGMSFYDDDKTVVAEDDDGTVFDIPPEVTPGWEIATVVDEPEPPIAEARLLLDGHPDVRIALLPGEEFLVGRDIRVASWVPDDLRISRRHFRISTNEHGFAIEDLASSNGTYVNGAFVREAQLLADDDVIEVGHLRAVFKLDGLPLTEY